MARVVAKIWPTGGKEVRMVSVLLHCRYGWPTRGVRIEELNEASLDDPLEVGIAP